jgi:acyl-CoA thioester hydrolase
MTQTARYRHPLNPRYLEVDRQGVVFNMWYLAYFDDALAGFLAAGGLPYPRLLAEGFDVSLVHTELDWTAGLAYGERAVIAVGVEAIGRTSFTLAFEVLREGAGAADGEPGVCRGRTVYVVVADDGSGKREIPPALLAVLSR